MWNQTRNEDLAEDGSRFSVSYIGALDPSNNGKPRLLIELIHFHAALMHFPRRFLLIFADPETRAGPLMSTVVGKWNPNNGSVTSNHTLA